MRQSLKPILNLLWCCFFTHTICAQQSSSHWENTTYRLQLGFHHVGVPFYKIIDNPLNVAVTVGVLTPLTQDASKSGRWFQDISLTWYNNSYSSSGVFLSSSTVFQKYIRDQLFISAELGLGVTGIWQPAQIYALGEGGWEKGSKSIIIRPVIPLGISTGYRLNSSSEIFLHYKPFVDLLYPSLGVLPQSVTSLGYRYNWE